MPMVNSLVNVGLIIVARLKAPPMPLRTVRSVPKNSKLPFAGGVVEGVVIARIAHERAPPVFDVVVELVRTQELRLVSWRQREGVVVV